MHIEAWWSTVQRVPESGTTEKLSMHTLSVIPFGVSVRTSKTSTTMKKSTRFLFY